MKNLSCGNSYTKREDPTVNVKLRHLLLIISILVGILAFLFMYFQDLLIVVDALFIAGVAISIAGAFVASRSSRYAVRRTSLYAFYPKLKEQLGDKRRRLKTGLFMIAVGVILMLMSIVIWEISKHRIF